MEKIVYLMLGSGGPPIGTGSVADLAGSLRSQGGHRIQVNLADPWLGHPFGVTPDDETMLIRAAVSVWVDAAEAARTGEVLPAGDWAAYLVTESEPLPNTAHPPAHDGRVAGFAQIVALTRPSHLSWGQWRRIWQGGHTAVALNTQSTFRYVQNVVFRALTPEAPPFCAVVEECFPKEAASDLHVFFDSVGDDAKMERHMAAMSESCDRFMDGKAPMAWTSEWVFPER